MQRSLFFLSIVIILGLNACQPAPAPSPTGTMVPTTTSTSTLHPIPTLIPSFTPTIGPTFTITPGPSPTSTPQATLASHQWQPQEVLILAGTRDTNSRTPFGTNINFILLADGQLIVRNCSQDVCSYLTGQMDRSQICSLLNTIDQAGFFDYDPSTFISPQQSAHKVFIQVNAWRSMSIELDQLDQWLLNPDWLSSQLNCTDCVQPPTIPSALADTFFLLKYFRPDNLETYLPREMAVWMTSPWVEGKTAPWPLDSPTLSDLYDRSRCQGSDQSQAVILQGDEASRVSEYINQMLALGYAPVFSDGQLKLQIVTQWLLPFEIPAGCSSSGAQSTLTPTPAPVQAMQCSPADGLVPIMTPTPTPRQ